MAQTFIFKVNDKIIKELFRHRIGENIAVVNSRELIYMFNQCIVYGCVVFRLAPGFLFKDFPYKIGEIDSLQRFFLFEMVDIVPLCVASGDRL